MADVSNRTSLGMVGAWIGLLAVIGLLGYAYFAPFTTAGFGNGVTVMVGLAFAGGVLTLGYVYYQAYAAAGWTWNPWGAKSGY